MAKPQATCIKKLKNTPCEIELQKHHRQCTSIAAFDRNRCGTECNHGVLYRNSTQYTVYFDTLKARQLPKHWKTYFMIYLSLLNILFIFCEDGHVEGKKCRSYESHWQRIWCVIALFHGENAIIWNQNLQASEKQRDRSYLLLATKHPIAMRPI